MSKQVKQLDRVIIRFAEVLGVELEVVPDAAHFLQEDQPDLIGRAIASWLSSPA